jgi:hypothetical protein
MLAPLLLVPLVLRGALNTGVVISIFLRSLRGGKQQYSSTTVQHHTGG